MLIFGCIVHQTEQMRLLWPAASTAVGLSKAFEVEATAVSTTSHSLGGTVKLTG